MAQYPLRTFLDRLEVVRDAFTAPGFRNAVVVVTGWVLTTGVHAVTQALVATDVARRIHHERFHRFFSRGAWDPNEMGRRLFFALLKLLPAGAPVWVAIDDTLARKRGQHIFGLGNHLDPVLSSKKVRFFSFGHCWVVLAVVIRLPFSPRTWALPILFRLYRTKKECSAMGAPYRKKTELAREMLDIVAGWTKAFRRPVWATADSAYSNETVLRDLDDEHVTFFGAMRPDAALTALPTADQQPRTGRRRLRGDRLPTPESLAADPKQPWLTCVADVYGGRRQIHFKTLWAQWYRSCGTRLVRVVVVRVDTGDIGLRVFFCTDPTVTVDQVLGAYAGRWSIEVCFRELKQLLGFEDSSARKKEAVERVAPFVGYIYTMLVLWFAVDVWELDVAKPPIRPWYRHKRGYCFADILRAAQRVLLAVDVLDLAREIDNLHQLQPPPSESRNERVRGDP